MDGTACRLMGGSICWEVIAAMWYARLAVISIVIGVLVSVGTSVAIGVYGKIPYSVRIDESGAWPVPVPSDWPEAYSLRSDMSKNRVMDVIWYSTLAHEHNRTPGDAWVLYLIEGGWPWRAFSISRHSAVSIGSTVVQTTDGIAVAPAGWRKPPKWRDRFGIIPLRPRWPGLLGNAGVWSAVVFLPLFGARLYRTVRRRKRGCCVHCGYQKDELPICPECGRSG